MDMPDEGRALIRAGDSLIANGLQVDCGATLEVDLNRRRILTPQNVALSRTFQRSLNPPQEPQDTVRTPAKTSRHAPEK